MEPERGVVVGRVRRSAVTDDLEGTRGTGGEESPTFLLVPPVVGRTRAGHGEKGNQQDDSAGCNTARCDPSWS